MVVGKYDVTLLLMLSSNNYLVNCNNNVVYENGIGSPIRQDYPLNLSI